MQLLANSVPSISTVGIVLAASAGIIGAIVALLKLGPEKDSAAVAQAQGANETLVALIEQLEKALERANERGDHYRDERDRARDELRHSHPTEGEA